MSWLALKTVEDMYAALEDFSVQMLYTLFTEDETRGPKLSTTLVKFRILFID